VEANTSQANWGCACRGCAVARWIAGRVATEGAAATEGTAAIGGKQVLEYVLGVNSKEVFRSVHF